MIEAVDSSDSRSNKYFEIQEKFIKTLNILEIFLSANLFVSK